MYNALFSLKDAFVLVNESLAGIYTPEEARSIAFLLLKHLNYEKTELVLRGGEKLGKEQQQQLQGMLALLKKHVPVQYVMGYTEFYDLRIMVGPGVLIPRPETEELVRWIIETHEGKQPRILDIGTGSGCIALALWKHLPGADITGMDISVAALRMARRNRSLHQASIHWVKEDISASVSSLRSDYDLIVSNPPYIPKAEQSHMAHHITDHEPGEALFVPDADPLVFYRHILRFSSFHLKPGGWIFAEIHENFYEQVQDLFSASAFHSIELKRDLNGKYRMVRAQKP
jgi:release factor glutamine methyltransferase